MENIKIKQFTDLIVWQKGHELVLLVYKMIKEFPKEEKFGLSSQITRAVVSVTSNIAEGFGRQTYKEKIQFYYIAQGSLVELTNQLYIAKDVEFINVDLFNKIFMQIETTHKLLNGLITKSKQIARI